jgi:pimeloyl-ACP methyl ester carboxylesterase
MMPQEVLRLPARAALVKMAPFDPGGRMPEFERDGWNLYYEDVGEGPPVLLIHGLLFDASQLEPQVRALKDRYRFITPDVRNHSRSEFRAEEYTLWDLMEDQIALLDHLGIERPTWGGVSTGGFLSLRAALKHPERVGGMVLIDTQGGPESVDMGSMYDAAAAAVIESGWTDDIMGLATGMLFGASASEELKAEWVEKWHSWPQHSAKELIGVVTGREDITDRLGEIDAPAIVIHGEEDVAIPMERAEQLAAGLPNVVEFVVVPKGGHTSTLEQPEFVTAAVERFLEKIAPPSAT